MHTRRSPLVLLVGVVLLLQACTQGNVFELAEGTCFDDPDGTDEISDVPIVECSEPHDNEVYATFEIPDGEYPGSEAVATAADEGCLERFQPWVGEPYETSVLFASYFAPTEESWDALGDREVVCYVFLDDEQLTGSAEGSGI